MVQHENEPAGESDTEGRDSGSVARITRLIAGEYLLTVNPVDGSEIERCPPGRRPGRPTRRAADEWLGRPAGEPAALLEREDERERLARLLGRGRSVRLTGPRGSGRTALLDAVAADVAELAPDGVIRLSGYHRGPSDLLQDLFAAVYDAPDQRPDRRGLRQALSTVGAVVVLDDLEFGGGTLDELLTATPECAYLFATTPEVPAPSEKSRVEEVFLPGLSRPGALDLLENLLARPLTDEETDWVGDLWFGSEGSPLVAVQAAALLRHRAGEAADDGASAEPDGAVGRGDAESLPALTDLPARVAAFLSANARAALDVAVVLGGELPDGGHLPALLDDDHARRAPEDLRACGLVTESGGHLRLAAGVAAALPEVTGENPAGGDDAVSLPETVARHYIWWVTHPSVSRTRVGAEADALVAAVQAAQRAGKAETAVRLARDAAPVLAAASRWSSWERVLRGGQEAARTAGAVAEQAYFHHELGVLALCRNNPERARSELDASIALRAALSDQHGTVSGRRALALVTDRLASAPGATGVRPGSRNGPTLAGAAGAAAARAADASGAEPQPEGPPVGDPGKADPSDAPTARIGRGTAASLPASGPSTKPTDVTEAGSTTPTRAGVPGGSSLDDGGPATGSPLSRAAAMDDSIAALRAAAKVEDDDTTSGGRGHAARNTRKNVLAAGAGAVLAAVLGTVVTLGAASDSSDDPSGGPAHPETSSSSADDHSDDPARTPDGPDRTTGPAPGTGSAEPSGEASPSPTSEAPSSPSQDPSPSESESSPTSSSGGSSSGGSRGGSGGSDSGGTDGGSDSGGTDGGSDGGSDSGGTDGGPGSGGTDGGGDTDGGTDGGADNGGSDNGGGNGGSDNGGSDNGGTDGGPGNGGTTNGEPSSSPTASSTPTTDSTPTAGSTPTSGLSGTRLPDAPGAPNMTATPFA